MILSVSDLGTAASGADSATVDALVAGANAQALRVAPCLADDTSSFDRAAEARMVLIGAVSRWLQAGSGAVQSQTAGPWSLAIDTRTGRTGYSLWPSEVATLRELCGGGVSDEQDAFMVDMTPDVPLSLASRPDLWLQWL